ncbi:RICIN domain-containing protein [Streptomyces jumonjinensis]|uniref:RICIN domain-containing protein n=2 Tax=Streptomyces jumonjinensis TaxID=1945 RepID=UPI00332A1967
MPSGLPGGSKHAGVLLLLLSPLLPVLLMGTVPAVAAPGEAINVIAAHSGKCLETENASADAGARVLQADCTGRTAAAWTVRLSTSGHGVNVVNVNSGKCLEIENGSSAIGAQARQADCAGQPGADFDFGDQGTHVWLQPLTAAPPRCLGVPQASHLSGAPVQLAECDDAIGTRFRQRLARAGNDPAEEEPEQPAPSVERVNLTGAGAQSAGAGGALSDITRLSADGRFAAFESIAADLVPGDTNNAWDLFVRDRLTGAAERVSVATGGAQADGHSDGVSISADGRYVAFSSRAGNLVAGDANGKSDVFLRDRQNGTTERVSVAAGGLEGNGHAHTPSISADGRYIAFVSNSGNIPGDTNIVDDVYVHDRQNGTLTRASVTRDGLQANDASTQAVISADGRYVAFSSRAGNLVAGDANASRDVFVRDLQAGAVERVSVRGDGAEAAGDSSAPSISTDGRTIAFVSRAADMVTGDTNGTDDVFVRDRQSRTTERVSVDSGGVQTAPSSHSPGISGNGRFVVFTSFGANLVTGDTNSAGDVFVRDRRAGVTTRVSTAVNGAQGNQDSGHPSISGDGRYIAFHSYAANLVPRDTNGADDYFVRTRVTVP